MEKSDIQFKTLVKNIIKENHPAAEECEKIWERFYRTSASKKFAKGSGLGLSIAKELVELHGGTLGVISEQNQGTTFTLRLPINNSD